MEIVQVLTASGMKTAQNQLQYPHLDVMHNFYLENKLFYPEVLCKTVSNVKAEISLISQICF